MAARNRISVLGSVSFGWLHAEGGFVFDEPFFMDPRVRLDRERAIRDFVAERFPDAAVYNMEAHLVQVEGRRTPVALVGALQPNLILGAAAGAKLVFQPDKDPDITPVPLADRRDLGALWNIDWAGVWPVSLFLEQLASMRREFRGDFAIIPSFFWDTTGRATIHGIVTTAQKLVGERIFLDMADDREFVHELFAWIGDAYVRLIRLFAEAAGMRTTGLHIGECSACMIGPEQFAEFVVPHLNRLADQVGPLRLHSCGCSNHLLDVFGGVQRLAVLNVGSSTSVARIRERFGPIRIDLTPEVQLLATGTAEQVDAWVRGILEENGEGELEFQYHLDLGQPEANGLQIQRALESLGVHNPRVAVY